MIESGIFFFPIPVLHANSNCYVSFDPSGKKRNPVGCWVEKKAAESIFDAHRTTWRIFSERIAGNRDIDLLAEGEVKNEETSEEKRGKAKYLKKRSIEKYKFAVRQTLDGSESRRIGRDSASLKHKRLNPLVVIRTPEWQVSL